MTTKMLTTALSATLISGLLLLSGCASDNMNSMDDSMEGHSMDQPMMKDSMDKSDDMDGMKGSM